MDCPRECGFPSDELRPSRVRCINTSLPNVKAIQPQWEAPWHVLVIRLHSYYLYLDCCYVTCLKKYESRPFAPFNVLFHLDTLWDEVFDGSCTFSGVCAGVCVCVTGTLTAIRVFRQHHTLPTPLVAPFHPFPLLPPLLPPSTLPPLPTGAACSPARIVPSGVYVWLHIISTTFRHLTLFLLPLETNPRLPFYLCLWNLYNKGKLITIGVYSNVTPHKLDLTFIL